MSVDLQSTPPVLLPLFVNLQGRNVLVVGAGSVALQKLESILPTGAVVDVIALQISPEVQRLAGQYPDTLRISERALSEEDLNPSYALIYLATNQPEAHQHWVAIGRERGIWMNAVDEPGWCDFYSAAVVRRGPLHVAISSLGELPSLVGALKSYLDALFPKEHLGEIQKLVDLRTQLKATMEDPKERMRVLQSIRTQLEARYLIPPRTP